MADYPQREGLEVLRSQLDIERLSFQSHYRDLADYILPRRPRFTMSDVNRGERRNQKIIDSTATMAARTLRSGMMAGLTSPARPWFRLSTPDPDLAEFGAVKEWLHAVTERMATIFLRSNIYNVLPICYSDIGVFGTHAMIIEEDMDTVIRAYPFPVYSYYLANDHKLKVNVFMREFRMTVRQIVQAFGTKDGYGKPDWSNISIYVKNLYDRGQYEAWVDVVHAIRPNENYDPKKIQAKYKKFSSCYYERGVSGLTGANYMGYEQDKFLRESGFDRFPVLAPRWEVTGEDVYGTNCPGMEALGDIKALQTMQKRKAQGIEKMINPPMVGPSSLRNSKASILPGDITYTDEREGTKGFRPAHEINIRVSELLGDIQDHQQRIKRCFFEDLFLMMSQSDRRQITATEIDERKEEKLLALGPVLEQLNQDLNDPLIDNVFDFMNAQGLLPPPPQELHGVDLKVEYISIMAQAQKLIGIGSVDRFSGFIANAAPIMPSILDKVDGDQLVTHYGDLLSIKPGIIRTEDETNAIRAQKAQQMQAQQMAQNIPQAASAVKSLADSNLDGDSALKRILDQGNAGRIVGG